MNLQITKMIVNNENDIGVIDSIFSGNDQQKV